MVQYKCKVQSSRFCFACASFVRIKSRLQFNEARQAKYKQAYGVKSIKNLNKPYTPDIICSYCSGKMTKIIKSGKPAAKTPAKWHKPKSADHKDCYLCNVKLALHEKKNPTKFAYPTNLSCTLPHDAEQEVESDASGEEESGEE